MTLKEAIRLVNNPLGYNAINFELFNFRPTDNSYVPGHDVRDYMHYYEPAEEFNEMQIKAWKILAHVKTFKYRRAYGFLCGKESFSR